MLPRDPMWKGFTLLAMWFFLLAFLAAACGGNARHKTLHTSFVGVTAACDGLDAWDTAKQEQMVAKADPTATTKEALKADIEKHRLAMDKLYAGCTLVYRSIATASMSTDDVTFKAATDEAQKLLDAIDTLKGAP